ncbi:STAS-like domain-containing protein [Clostridium sp.]|jgi:hypothetical protein|uniref:STAS-like domain-containing protein n=1 Tax=Clostridium sp. TaxID=1506 RepID=UPI0039F541C3
MKEIIVRDILGTNFTQEDIIVLKQMMNSYIDDDIVLDFQNVEEVPCTFFATLLVNLFFRKGREYVLSHLKVKNLTNTEAFNRVAYGTSVYKN